MLLRDISSLLTAYTQFPAIVIQGPRQVGKTFLAQQVFTKHVYTNFEDPDTRRLALEDPRKFLHLHENEHGIIIDEFQYVPHMLSYLQLEIDAKNRPGYFVLTGSQNFLMNQAITQSLAGRVGILTMLPLSLHELQVNGLRGDDIDQILFNGGYPRLYDQNYSPLRLYPPYIHTYLERDVRQLVNVKDLTIFQRFIGLCAVRIGQQLNVLELATACGISAPTARGWLSMLEASYILFQLPPYFKNFNKRLTKSPKIYFHDTGLACSLLGIESPQILARHPLYGNIFENFMVADVYKQYCVMGKRPPLYYWRDLNGRLEVDCIIEEGLGLFPIEIKSGMTVKTQFFDAIDTWRELAQVPAEHSYVIYGGDLNQQRTQSNIVGWKHISTLVEKIRLQGAHAL